jgi:hypothetical protein
VLVPNRRDFLRFSAGIALSQSPLIAAATDKPATPPPSTVSSSPESLFTDLLVSWCDGLVKHQIRDIPEDALRGGLLCPACGLIHGRCGDAVYPLLWAAHSTQNSRYLDAAIAVHSWSERQVSRADGSWVNDVALSSWKGITVFHAIALAEALHHHGSILDPKVRQAWTDRLAKAATFLDGFMNIEVGNINYPVTSSYCFVVCGQVLNNSHYIDRGRQMAHEALQYFTPNNILFGEGHPLKDVTRKGCRPVDLGYNVEESLPALAMYSILTGDAEVRDKVLQALAAHMEFILPDGAWDNSWGSRNYKWSWWGSRTSDGCQPAYVLLSDHDPRFLDAALRNTQLMAHCTHEGLLYGGPHYFQHGDFPCIHHTFTHAKALATTLDRGRRRLSAQRRPIPRETPAYEVKSFPETGTHLVAVGPWRATVTENDWEYVEHVQSGSGGGGGGHASGGALSTLFHVELGPVLTASMTEYQIIENSNQQVVRGGPQMPLTPRIEYAGDKTYTSLSDLNATVKVTHTSGAATITAAGKLLTKDHQPPAAAQPSYWFQYRPTSHGFEIAARFETSAALSGPVSLILPVISGSEEKVTKNGQKSVQIQKQSGTLVVHTNSPRGFRPLPEERTFNLVPGFECIPLIIDLTPGEQVTVVLQVG